MARVPNAFASMATALWHSSWACRHGRQMPGTWRAWWQGGAGGIQARRRSSGNDRGAPGSYTVRRMCLRTSRCGLPWTPAAGRGCSIRSSDAVGACLALCSCCLTSELTGDQGIGAAQRRTLLVVRVERPVRQQVHCLCLKRCWMFWRMRSFISWNSRMSLSHGSLRASHRARVSTRTSPLCETVNARRTTAGCA